MERGIRAVGKYGGGSVGCGGGGGGCTMKVREGFKFLKEIPKLFLFNFFYVPFVLIF